MKDAFRKKAAPPQRGNAREDTAPRWDLSRLYPSINSPEMMEDRQHSEDMVRDFSEAYEDSICYLSGAALGEAIQEYEAIEDLMRKISSYITLLEAEDRGNLQKTAPIRKWLSETQGRVIFFEEEISDMREQDLITKLSAPELAQYAPWIARVRAERNYMLTPEVEEMSGEYGERNMESWNRLYFETMADMRVEYQGKKYSIDAAHELMGAPETPAQEAALIRREIGATLKKNSRRVALIYNTMIKDRQIDGDLRKYSRPDHEMNLQNGLDPAIVDTMYETVKASYSGLSHKYYRWKAEQHKTEVLPRGMINDPLPGEPEDRVYGWDEARKIVLRSFRKFSPKFQRLAQKFFDEKRIDAEVRPNKDSGGFCLSTDTASGPFILINYDGTVEDIASALGHELGHGVHQILAEKARGALLSDMPITVAETASIFAEMLVFDEMLQAEKDPAMRKKLLMAKVENMLGNGLGQLAYYDFERRAHDERQHGELSAESLADLWQESQRRFLGTAVEMDDYDRHYWMMVPHLYEMPFYVYSYSFAQVMVGTLYHAYRQAEAEGVEEKEAFVESYIELLETGNTRNFHEMFESFGLDPETPEFWEEGLSLIAQYMDELIQPTGPAPAAAQRKEADKAAPPPAGSSASDNPRSRRACS